MSTDGTATGSGAWKSSLLMRGSASLNLSLLTAVSADRGSGRLGWLTKIFACATPVRRPKATMVPKIVAAPVVMCSDPPGWYAHSGVREVSSPTCEPLKLRESWSGVSVASSHALHAFARG
jgi:hypothetical protein